MSKKMAIFLLCFTIAVVGFCKVASAAYSEGVVKECEKLKALKNDNKDMPASLPGIKEITGDELKKWMDGKKKIVIMDNRPKAEYDKEHITGAVLVPVDDLMKDSKIIDKYNKNDSVINYCNGVKCWRSPATTLLLKELGFKNIYWYRNGLPDWIKKDYPTVEGK